MTQPSRTSESSSLTIALVVPRRHFICDSRGFGIQVPLGMVCIGGPLLDAGHRVHLVDNDLEGLGDEALAERVAALAPDAVLVGHPASYAAHPATMRTARALRARLPDATFVYGGVYPTYAAEEVLRENPAIDIVVRGEGEETVLALARARFGRMGPSALADVSGISYRDGEVIHRNPARAPIADLDRYRPGFELVDYRRYQLLGLGPTAGLFYSRGCPLHCTFCGQFGFWKRWRHRSPGNVVAHLRTLVEVHGVRSVWFADENFGADPVAARELLEAIIDADLGLSLNINLTAADVVRDEALLPLYRRAGVDHVSLGIETLDDDAVVRIQKNNPEATSRRALALLRKHGMMSLANVIHGFPDDTPRSIWRTFRGLLRVDPDVVNALFLAPLFWTVEGRRTDPALLASADQGRYSYRDPVVRPRRMALGVLFLLVKASELFFHTRPRALWRMLFDRDHRRRGLVRRYFFQGIAVWFSELADFVTRRDRLPAGGVTRLPGAPRALAPTPAAKTGAPRAARIARAA